MKERALLVALVKPGESERVYRSLEEFKELVKTAGGEVVDMVIQRRQKVDPGYYVGKGKAKEIAELCQSMKIDMVVFNTRLSPAQLRNLSEIIPCKVLDRVDIVLDIFAQHATTAEAKIQVELAQLQYRLARLRAAPGYFSRLGGGIGTRGPGETKLEIDRRRILQRIAFLRRKLKDVEKARLERMKRHRDFFRVALVGYTSAGKTTLLNVLTKSKLKESPELFTTLDTYTRGMYINGKTILIYDTVGFISELPTQLISAFKSTLAVAKEADLLLVVVDVSKPDFRDNLTVVEETLKEIGAGEKPKIYVFNKIDLIPSKNMLERLMEEFSEDAVFISAKTGENLDLLKEKILYALTSNKGN
ncbi:GTPase HflX [Candidatus Caldipriscus sp.]|nr:GTPase HflX [Candidatus Caldipriscus sp.]